jgi:electron-transferring-flavoprotein dehydrogenase
VLALGLVAGLDYGDRDLDIHDLLQRMKLHPLFRQYLDNGEMVEWGAKTIPEGGYHSIPERRHGDGAVILGDSAGYVDVASLKGIHYAVLSGMFAARAIFAGLMKDDTSAATLAEYDRLVDGSVIHSDLHKRRNMRLAFKDGFFKGGFKSSLMTLSGGTLFGGQMSIERDAEAPRVARKPAPALSDTQLTTGKLDAVFRSGNRTRDDIPNHLIAGKDIPPEVADFYSHVCPAGVYERDGDRLVINAPNCIDCKATDVLGPRWTPREGGSGPAYRRM